VEESLWAIFAFLSNVLFETFKFWRTDPSNSVLENTLSKTCTWQARRMVKQEIQIGAPVHLSWTALYVRQIGEGKEKYYELVIHKKSILLTLDLMEENRYNDMQFYEKKTGELMRRVKTFLIIYFQLNSF